MKEIPLAVFYGHHIFDNKRVLHGYLFVVAFSLYRAAKSIV